MHSVCTLHTLKSTLRGSDKGIVLNDLALVFRFGVIFKKCLKGKFSKSNEHLWQHVGTEIANFQMPTYEQDVGPHQCAEDRQSSTPVIVCTQ